MHQYAVSLWKASAIFYITCLVSTVTSFPLAPPSDNQVMRDSLGNYMLVGNPGGVDNSEFRLKRPALSINRDMDSLAAMMHMLQADKAHAQLLSLGKRAEIAGENAGVDGGEYSDIVKLLYKYHLNPVSKQIKKNRLSVDMQLSAISDMLDSQRMRSAQQQAHSALLKIGKRNADLQPANDEDLCLGC